MLNRIITGFIAMLVAFLLVKFRYKIQETFGSVSFMERYFGSTEMGIFLIAILIFIGALMHMTGTLDDLVVNTLGKLF